MNNTEKKKNFMCRQGGLLSFEDKFSSCCKWRKNIISLGLADLENRMLPNYLHFSKLGENPDASISISILSVTSLQVSRGSAAAMASGHCPALDEKRPRLKLVRNRLLA
jgi:hypothetical protein